MSTTAFTDPDWKNTFSEAGYTDFDSLWNVEGELVEEGNFRGKDDNTFWSHVSRVNLPNGKMIYIKRQQNHFPNNLILKLRKLLTFEIEWKNYQRLQAAGVPTMKIIHFDKRKQNGNRQCILVSEELKDMTPMGDLIKWFNEHGWPARKQRLAMLDAIVKTVHQMHSHGMIHNALYGRHIYINVPFVDGTPVFQDSYHTCLIDLERTKYPGPKSAKRFSKDLQQMYNKANGWPMRDRIWFLKRYLQIDQLTPEAKTIAREISTR